MLMISQSLHLFCLPDNMIIAYNNKKLNNLNQKKYDTLINSIDLGKVICPKCKKSGFHYHGHYYRKIFSNWRYKTIKITRVKCTSCNSTHAILCEPMIPYTSILESDITEVLANISTTPLDNTHVSYLSNKIKSIEHTYNNICNAFSRSLYMCFHLIPT